MLNETPHHEHAEVLFHVFLTSSLHGASRPGIFISADGATGYSLDRRLGGPQNGTW